MARRAAKSGPAGGQDELGSSGSRDEKEAEHAGEETGVDSRVSSSSRGANNNNKSGPRKLAAERSVEGGERETPAGGDEGKHGLGLEGRCIT